MTLIGMKIMHAEMMPFTIAIPTVSAEKERCS
jgi:hypothetical protein